MQQEILSRSRLEPIIHKLSLYREDMARTAHGRLVGKLRSSIDVTAVQPMARTNTPGVPGFSIRVIFAEPSAAQQICSTVTSMFLEENLRLRQHQAEQTSDSSRSRGLPPKPSSMTKTPSWQCSAGAHRSLPEDQTTNLNILGGLARNWTPRPRLWHAPSRQDLCGIQPGRAASGLAGHARRTQSGDLRTANHGLGGATHGAEIEVHRRHPDVAKVKRDLATARKMAQANQAKLTPANPTGTTQVEPPQLKVSRDQIRQYELVIQDRTAQQEETRRKIKMYQARVESTPAIGRTTRH